eukprot:COSAG06_NODE_30002_length_546_cov_4.510067_1_plen_46_part_10
MARGGRARPSHPSPTSARAMASAVPSSLSQAQLAAYGADGFLLLES